MFWLELLCEIKILDKKLLDSLMQENDEIIAIVVSSIKTTRGKQKMNFKIRIPHSTIQYKNDYTTVAPSIFSICFKANL